jgi:enoyl-CoA hydratase
MTVQFEIAAHGVGVATIHDHPTRNALTPDTVRELNRLLKDERGRVIGFVVHGSGPVFCSAADIRGLNAGGASTQPSESRLSLIRSLWHCPIPVVAAVDGLALGGGVELCLVCDAVVCTEGLEFGFPELGLGVIRRWQRCCCLRRSAARGLWPG